MIDSVTGVILTGGKSSRMGKNKALLPFRGKHLIDQPIEIMSRIFSNVALSVREPADYARYSLLTIADQYDAIGPIGGICSVLKSGYSRIFCVACDMPFLNDALITHLCSFPEFDAVIPVWKAREEVLHAVYSDTLISTFEKAIGSRQYKLTNALSSAKVRYVGQDEVRRFDPSGDSFKNVNTPGDYEKLEDSN
jgi:molybdopterin-guanine dinucleotide biosynthesis protein A